MRAVVQRVTHASVHVDNRIVGEIQNGFLVLLGVSRDDTEQDAEYMASKISGLRIFDDENDQLNLTLSDVGGDVLLISQFTLYGDARKGRRPSFVHAAAGEEADRLYRLTAEKIHEQGIHVETGVFGAHMEVHLCNDGPVTILIDSKKGF
ncbi:MAG: D-tyrosyl-tRNA(Tyr) deacylase [Tissierellia bacterium]|jgi:D-tyrosyl-tRNA(Tyr) deacylase|nr:D-aminoacyl-tRNA deacylase [Bacillota bacterium]NLL22678.1 D-tyrosyl-tRNA(Tyr) deacylase [Tissierellia bacterium]